MSLSDRTNPQVGCKQESLEKYISELNMFLEFGEGCDIGDLTEKISGFPVSMACRHGVFILLTASINGIKERTCPVI